MQLDCHIFWNMTSSGAESTADNFPVYANCFNIVFKCSQAKLWLLPFNWGKQLESSVLKAQVNSQYYV